MVTTKKKRKRPSRHKRKYRSKRYTKKRGQTNIINPSILKKETVEVYSNPIKPVKPKSVDGYLPINQAVYVPSTNHLQKQVSESEFQNRIILVKKKLSYYFGGYSSIEGMGGYYSKDEKRVISEPVVIVRSFSAPAKFKKNQLRFLEWLRKICGLWGQETIGYEFESDLYYVTPRPK